MSFRLCPFVHRSLMVLEAKQVPYSVEYIDLANKPEWFLELSPTGKVPCLVVDSKVIFESTVINELLEELTPEPRLMPTDPLERATVRMWVEQTGAVLGGVYRLIVSRSESEAKSTVAATHDRLALFGEQIAGPYFLGDEYSLVDISIAPALMRFGWIEAMVGDLGLFEGLPRVRAWCEALLDRPCVERATFEGMREEFREHVLKQRGPDGKPAWLAQRLLDGR